MWKLETPLNSALLNAVADQIERDPDSYNQKTWGCGSSHCIAGWAVALSPNHWLDRDNPDITYRAASDAYVEPFDTAEVALELLGLDVWEERLFGRHWLPPTARWGEDPDEVIAAKVVAYLRGLADGSVDRSTI